MLKQLFTLALSVALVAAHGGAHGGAGQMDELQARIVQQDMKAKLYSQNDVAARDSGYLECNGRKVVNLEPGTSVTVVSKNYPDEYENSDECGWHFKTVSGGEIIFMCDVFSMGWGDYMELYQVSYSKKSYLVARSRMHYWNYVNVVFTANYLFADVGFKCTASAPAAPTTQAPETTVAPTEAVTEAAQETKDNNKASYCPSEYPDIFLASGSSMTVLSPNYPEQYPGNVRCGWNFKTDEGSTLEVTCDKFNLSNKDQVMLAHGPRANKHKFHFDNAPQNEQFTKGRLMMRFRSSPYTPGDGFNCTVSAF